MSEPGSHPAPGPRLAQWLVLAMLAMVTVPAIITLNTVHVPAKFQITDIENS